MVVVDANIYLVLVDRFSAATLRLSSRISFRCRSIISSPEAAIAVAVSANRDTLNAIVNGWLQEHNSNWKPLAFNFVVHGELLVETVKEFVIENHLAIEDVLDVHCLVSERSPTPECSLTHDDWVAAICASENRIVSGSYSGGLFVWAFDGTLLSSIDAGSGPIKCLDCIGADGGLRFVCGSQDQTLTIWKCTADDQLKRESTFRGHERSVECVGAQEDRSVMASGDFAGFVKIWQTDAFAETSCPKKFKHSHSTEEDIASVSKTPIVTLAGHRESVSGLCWSSTNELFTCSWDHSLVLWDLEFAGKKCVLSGKSAFTDIAYSDTLHVLLSASVDKYVRLWDPRAKDASMVKTRFSGHNGWISGVRWSGRNEFCFASSSFDFTTKLWDTRSAKAPLYDLLGHEDKVLCLDWSNPDYVVSGSADCTAKTFRFSP